MAKGFHTTVVFNRYLMIGEQQAALISLGLDKIIQEAKNEAKDLVRIDTTALQKSIASRKVGIGMYELYTNVEYAVYQEFGFTHVGGGYVHPQPFMFPAAHSAGKKIDRMIAEVLKMDFR